MYPPTILATTPYKHPFIITNNLNNRLTFILFKSQSNPQSKQFESAARKKTTNLAILPIPSSRLVCALACTDIVARGLSVYFGIRYALCSAPFRLRAACCPRIAFTRSGISVPRTAPAIERGNARGAHVYSTYIDRYKYVYYMYICRNSEKIAPDLAEKTTKKKVDAHLWQLVFLIL